MAESREKPGLGVRKSRPLRRRIFGPEAEVSSRDEERIYYAIDSNETVLLQILLDQGITPNCRFPSQRGKTALHLSCEKGHIECARVLVDAGANTSLQDDWFQTPLMYSVCTGRSNMVRFLIDSDCELEIKDKFEKTALHYSVNDCETDSLKELINGGANLNAIDFQGRTPLWTAVSEDGHVEVVRCLVEAHCNVNLADVRERRTPVQVAILHSKIDLLEYISILLTAGASPDVIDLYGFTPMMCLIKIASGNGPQVSEQHLEVARLLVDAGCDVDRKETLSKYQFQFDGTALKMATDHKLAQLAELLLAAGADPDIQDKCSAPLHVAARDNSIDIGKMLIQANCQLYRLGTINLQGNILRDVTPLFCALISGNFDFAEMIITADYDFEKEVGIYHNFSIAMELFNDSNIAKRLKEIQFKPRSLVSLGRSAVRKHCMGGNFRKKVESLELPETIKSGLLFIDILNTKHVFP